MMTFYAVHKGYVKGVYLTIEECKKNTETYDGAKYAIYCNMKDAEEFVETGQINLQIKSKKKQAYTKIASMIAVYKGNKIRNSLSLPKDNFTLDLINTYLENYIETAKLTKKQISFYLERRLEIVIFRHI